MSEDTTISCCLVVVLIAPTSKFKKILLIQNGDKLFQLWFENSKTAKMLTRKAVPAKVFTSTVGENPFHLPLSTGMFCPYFEQ